MSRAHLLRNSGFGGRGRARHEETGLARLGSWAARQASGASALWHRYAIARAVGQCWESCHDISLILSEKVGKLKLSPKP